MEATLLSILLALLDLPSGPSRNPNGGICYRFEVMVISCKMSDGTEFVVNGDDYGNVGLFINGEPRLVCDADMPSATVRNCEEVPQ